MLFVYLAYIPIWFENRLLKEVMKMADKDNTIKNFTKRINAMSSVFKSSTDEFNEIVKEAVALSWKGYDINSTVNSVLDLALVMKGLNRRALATYFVKCVPYGFSKKENRFEKKDAKKAEKLADNWEDFVNSHDWFEEAKSTDDAKPYELNVATLVQMIERRVNKADDSGTLEGQKAVETMQSLKSKLDSTINEYIKTFTAQAHSDLVMEQNAESVEDHSTIEEAALLDEEEQRLLDVLEAEQVAIAEAVNG